MGNPISNALGRPLIFHAHDKDEMYRVDADSDAVEVAISPDYQRNISSTRKFRYVDVDGRPIPKGEENSQPSMRQWASGSWVKDPDNTEWQHHVYLFQNEDGTTDVYGHKETSAAKDPLGHVSDKQVNGDPDELVLPILNGAGISKV